MIDLHFYLAVESSILFYFVELLFDISGKKEKKKIFSAIFPIMYFYLYNVIRGNWYEIFKKKFNVPPLLRLLIPIISKGENKNRYHSLSEGKNGNKRGRS